MAKTKLDSDSLGLTKNLLVGTAVDNGTDKLQVNGSVAASSIGVGYSGSPDAKIGIRGGNGTYSGGISMAAGGGNVYAVYPSLNDLVFRSVTGSKDVLTMTYNGNVLINTSTDNGTDRLQVGGSVQIANNLRIVSGTKSSLLGVDVNGQYLEAVGDSSMRHFAGGVERMRVTSSGNLLIGTSTDNSTDKLQIAGSMRISAGFGCNGKTAQAAYPVGAAATDAATTQALVNQLRAALIAAGITI